jgi:hypothetical protein
VESKGERDDEYKCSSYACMKMELWIPLNCFKKDWQGDKKE